MRLRHLLLPSLILAAAMASGAARAARQVRLEDLDLSLMTTGWGQVHRARSVDNNAMTVAGKRFEHGVGAHAPSAYYLDLNGGAERFTASVGLDSEVAPNRGSVEFQVYGDGKLLWKSGVMTNATPAKAADVDLRGVRRLRLMVTDGGDGNNYDHADWGDATFTVSGADPVPLRDPRTARIATAHFAMAFAPGGDGRLYQTYLGPASGQPNGKFARLEEVYPAAGDGYFLEPALQVTHADGNTSTDLQVVDVKSEPAGPDIVLTRVELKDPAYPFHVTLCFKAYQQEDIVEQWTEVRHSEPGPVVLSRFASASPLIKAPDYYLTQFHGDWANEVNREQEKLTYGIKTIDTKIGVRADQFRQPFFLLSLGAPATEESGQVMGGAIEWSGSYQFAFEVDHNHNLRALCGMNPYASQYRVKPGETFTTPAMLLGWSENGTGELSRKFHRWGRTYGMRDGNRPRAVLLNNWEATGFNFDEKKLVSLFGGARDLGVELFLLDDGWFANKYPRNNDDAGLGDWEPNHAKLPHGVSYLADEAKKAGVRFGIWVEPEMVNPRSELFEKHPDWVIRQPQRALELQRNQLILDLSRPAVREYVFKVVDDLLTQNPGVSYVKWDCNRYITQPGSPYLKPDEQSHLWIDYTNALYDIMDRVVKRHPGVELMICSGGGGRSDYGALRRGHEFWPSDNTDPIRRVFIQYGYSQVLPAIATACHVTRWGNRPLKFAFDVAMSGTMGLDLDVDHLSAEDKRFAASSIATYKAIRDVVQLGDLYRLESPYDGPRASLMYVSPDRKHAVAFFYQTADGAVGPAVKLKGLDPTRSYRVREINLREGKTSQLAQNGQTVTGAAIAADGLTPAVAKQCDSVVVELTAE